MHKLASLFSLCAMLGLVAPACSSSSDTAPDDTCGFIADANNCYRKLLATVDECLTDASSDAGSGFETGALSADGLSCTYASGRIVTFGGDARQYSAAKSAIDVTVALGGKTCVHYVSQPQSSLSVTGPDGGVLRVAVAGLGETITCPDGSKHGIDVQKLLNGCGDAGSAFSGGLPGTTTASGGNSVSGSLAGQKNEAYSCKSP